MGIWLRRAALGVRKTTNAVSWDSQVARTWPATMAPIATNHMKRALTIPMSIRQRAVPNRSQPYPNGSEARGITNCPASSRNDEFELIVSLKATEAIGLRFRHLSWHA